MVGYAIIFYENCMNKSLKLKDVTRIIFVLLIFLLPSWLGLVIIVPETAASEDAIGLALKYIGIPFGAFFYFIAYCAHSQNTSFFGKIVAWLWPLPAAATMAFFSIGYILLANAFTGSQQSVTVSGPVLSTRFTGVDTRGRDIYVSGRTTYYLTVEFRGRAKELYITRDEFLTLKIGDFYSRKMKLGGLGYYYSWRVSFQK